MGGEQSNRRGTIQARLLINKYCNLPTSSPPNYLLPLPLSAAPLPFSWPFLPPILPPFRNAAAPRSESLEPARESGIRPVQHASPSWLPRVYAPPRPTGALMARRVSACAAGPKPRRPPGHSYLFTDGLGPCTAVGRSRGAAAVSRGRLGGGLCVLALTIFF